jgi:hypothetical protein
MKSAKPESYLLGDVFTPSSANPQLNFVDRGEVEEDLGAHLSTKARPICIEGPFRSGKTSIVLKKVKELYQRSIHVVCNEASTFDGLLSRALDDLAPFYAEAREGVEKKVSPGISAEFFGLRGQLGGKEREAVTIEKPVQEPQKTSAAVARFAVAANAAWIIDDAHKLQALEFAKLAAAMREWQTLDFEKQDTKMIVIASEVGGSTATERLIAAAPDLTQRLVSLRLSLMTDAELLEIIRRGEKLLKVDCSQIQNSLVDYSFGYPGICHDLCAHACRAAGVLKTQTHTVKLEPNHFQKGLTKYIKECSPNIRFALRNADRRISESISHAFFVSVLEKIKSRAMNEGFSQIDLIKKVHSDLGLSEEVVRKGIGDLMNEETGVLRLDAATNVVFFKEPLYYVQYAHEMAAASETAHADALVDTFLRLLKPA